MRIYLSYFTVVTLYLSVTNLHAQLQDLPNVSELNTFYDFRKTEPQVRKILKWLANPTSISSKDNRKKHINFIDDFIQKSDYIKFNPLPSLVSLKRKSEYFLQFKIGWLTYVFSFEYSRNLVENHYQAFTHLLTFYKNHKKKFGRNSSLEKLKKMQEKKELKEYIKKAINSN